MYYIYSKKNDKLGEQEFLEDKTENIKNYKKIKMIKPLKNVYNMENQIEIFKNNKTQNYYKYLKIFAIMQRESNRVIRELWSLIKTALNDIMPNSGQEEEYPQQPEDNNDNYEQNNENNSIDYYE